MRITGRAYRFACGRQHRARSSSTRSPRRIGPRRKGVYADPAGLVLPGMHATWMGIHVLILTA